MPEPQTPPYPQYPALLERARATAPRHVSPADLDRYRDVIRRRGGDWCTAVLGRGFPGLGRITVPEARLLLLADADDLTPPLPDTVLAARARQADHDRELAERRRRLEDADAERWAEAVAGSRVPVQVRANRGGRRYRTGLASGPLRHAVPVVDAESGPAHRPRSHPAGRAVCERVDRARPRDLTDPVEQPATCRSCLTLVPRLRPAAG